MKTTTARTVRAGAAGALLRALLCLGVSMGALGAEVRIRDVDEFITFKNNVNSGTNYSETTVFLDSDIDLTEKTFEHIGNYSNYFLGVFDGQGHLIRNLAMNSSSKYAGLFGYSEGLTIKNVILDPSCSITNYYSYSNDVFVGGIIGYCKTENGPCTIENGANMGSVSFNGYISNNYLYIGGIIGYIRSYNYNSIIKNCANYGDVTHSGTSFYSYIGGIIGYYDGYYLSKRAYIYNILNQGTITHNGTTLGILYLGGIIGRTSYTTIENCVSSGEVSSSGSAKTRYVGSIVGHAYIITVNYCYFSSDLSTYEKYGDDIPSSESNTFSYDDTTFKLNGTASIGNYAGNTLIGALNAAADYYYLRDYSYWLLNMENKDVSFIINGKSTFTLNSQIIFMPSLANEGMMNFDGWYEDEGLTTPLTSHEVTSNTNLYGRFSENTNNYTITFDSRREGVTVAPITAPFNSVVTLLNDLTDGRNVFGFWETEYGDRIDFNFIMSSHNVTLYAVWKCSLIKTPEDFIIFENSVNKGVNYNGTTVFLDSDLDFTGKAIEPIGNSEFDYFSGVFDGQGHVISNLKMASSSYYVGLFGYSYGFTIRNVILDSSCYITSSYKGFGSPSIGGIIGLCYADNGKCTIENSVNMGSVSFSGNVSRSYFYLGGIVGALASLDKYGSTVKNCANYGDVTHSGTSKDSIIGGIVGFYGSYYNDAYIYNSLNHGTITHNGITSDELDIGGIIGYTEYTTIENCVSGGKISSNNSGYIGSIVGYVSSGTSINYCYYTSELSDYKKSGYTEPNPSESYTLSYDISTLQLNDTVSIGSYTGKSLIDALNVYSIYYTDRDYSHWLLNKDNKDVAFTISKRSTFTLSSQIILLPSLASEGNISFDGWYMDSELTSLLVEYEVTESITLYGRFEVNTNNYTISFDTKAEGAFVEPVTAPFNSVVTLPSDSIREHCTVGWWENKHGDYIGLNLTVPAHDITLYAVWKCTHIESLDDFIDFSNVVNNGMNYSGTTVFLDSDIDLSGKTFEPIGVPDSNYFNGTFDGQGHVISNLKMNSSSQIVGLFGYSGGFTIRNVILDSSCSITSYSSNSAYVGGIIGYCQSNYGLCAIENSVNMASVTFRGTISGSIFANLYLGGIAGDLSPHKYDITVKNCANYGDVTQPGTSGNSHIGGIVGHSSYRVYIYNSLNHGTITHNGTTSDDLYLGGIAGRTYYTTIDNCVSGGKISSTKTSYIGSIVGWIFDDTSISYCYFTSELSDYKKYGKGTPSSESNTLNYDSTTLQLNDTVSIGDYASNLLIGALNAYSDYYILGNYSHWLLNKDNKDVSFTINGRTPFTLNYQIIILPSLASEGNMSFDGWYEDDGLTTPLITSEITSNTKYYGKYCGPNFTVIIDVNGGGKLAEKEMIIDCDRVYGDLPAPSRVEHMFIGWFTKRSGGKRIETGSRVAIYDNHTLYAHWSINNYTLTFVFGNGTEPEKRVLNFNETITYPADPVRVGYSFTEWTSKPDKMPANDLTVTAQWTTNQYTVTFNSSEGIVSQSTKTVTFDSPYGDLPEATRTGYTFAGWYTEKNESITEEAIVKIPDNHTLFAHWAENPTNQTVNPTKQVEIVFSTKDMTRKEIEEIVKKYTEADFAITVIESNNEETRVIVEFVDTKKAEEFVRNVNAELGRGEKNKFKRIEFVQGGSESFSIAYHPMTLLYLF